MQGTIKDLPSDVPPSDPFDHANAVVGLAAPQAAPQAVPTPAAPTPAAPVAPPSPMPITAPYPAPSPSVAAPTSVATPTPVPSPAPLPALDPTMVAATPAMLQATPPAPPTPTYYPPEESSNQKPRFSFKPQKLAVGIIGAVVFILLASGVGFAYMVTYQDFSFGQTKLQREISHAVQMLPFAPKTPSFLLERNLLAHQDVTRERFNLSIAAQSDSLASAFGTEQLDMEISGAIDYTDINNPLLEMDASITNEFKFSIRKPNKVVYFQVTQVPELIAAFVGPDYDTYISPFINQWISYDTTQLSTDARDILNQERADEALQPTDMETFLNSGAYKQFIAATTVENAELADGTKAYKLHTDIPAEVIDYLFEETAKNSAGADFDRYLYESNFTKVSDVFSKATTEVWLEENTYLMRKMTMSFVIDPSLAAAEDPSLAEFNTPVRMVISYSGDKYGEVVEIAVPKDSITVEEAVAQFQELMMRSYDTSMYPSEYYYDDSSLYNPSGNQYGYDSQSLYDSQAGYGDVLGAFREYLGAEQN